VSDDEQQPTPPPARPDTDATFKQVQESGGQKPRPRSEG
jgi:hypothetical protein